MLKNSKRKQYLEFWDDMGHFSVEGENIADAIDTLYQLRSVKSVKVVYDFSTGLFSIEKEDIG